MIIWRNNIFFRNRGGGPGEVRIRKRSRSQHDTLHGAITNISEETTAAIEESIKNIPSHEKSDETEKTNQTANDELQTSNLESGVPSKLLPTNNDKESQKKQEKEYMTGDEFHSLAVVAFPLSSISPMKYPPSNNFKKDKRTT